MYGLASSCLILLLGNILFSAKMYGQASFRLTVSWLIVFFQLKCMVNRHSI